MAVDKNHADKDAAETLIKKVEETATNKGMRKIYTFIHKTVKPVFEKQGFEVVPMDKIPLNIKKTDEYVFFRDLDFVCMLKRTENFVEADEELEIYSEADLKKHLDQ